MMSTIVEYQIETPEGVVIYSNVKRSFGWILAQAREAGKARRAGDIAGAAEIAGQLLECLGEIKVRDRPDDFWQLATQLQEMVDDFIGEFENHRHYYQ